MEKTDDRSKGTMVIATVKGDVHDIGKNLVDIILSNNGYRVVNLGIKVPIDVMLDAVQEHRADAIGMSGLLVKSTLVMKENLQIMVDRGIDLPVVLGGAALNRRYVESDLREIFGDNLGYAEDAFGGLRFMDAVVKGVVPAEIKTAEPKQKESQQTPQKPDLQVRTAADDEEVSQVASLPGGNPEALKGADPDDVLVALIDDQIVGGGRIAHVADLLYLLEGIVMVSEVGGSAAMLDLVRAMVADVRGRLQGNAVALLTDPGERMKLMLFRGIGFEQIDEGDDRFALLEEQINGWQERHEAPPAVLFAREGLGVSRDASTETSRSDRRQEDRRSDVERGIEVPVPPFWGSRVVENVDLDKVFEYINEVALIRGQWGVKRGKRSPEEYQRELQEQIHPALDELKREAKRERLLKPTLVYGYFPVKSDGNRLIVYRPSGTEGGDLHAEWDLPAGGDLKSIDGGLRIDPGSLQEWETFEFPRQEGGKRLCIADYFRSVDESGYDVLPVHLVTVGRRASEHSARLFEQDRYRDYLYFHGLSVESAEALAEYWHRSIRIELDIADEDADDIRKLFAQGYRGSRYSFGYPACPDLENQRQIVTMLAPERIDVELSEEFMLDPEQSTSAIVVHHPEAKYFNV